MNRLKPQRRRELAKLLAAHCDQGLDESGRERLEALLAVDEEARRYYLQYLDLHLEIDHRLKQEGIVVMPRPAKRKPSWTRGAAAAILVVGLGATLWMMRAWSPEGGLSLTGVGTPSESVDLPVAYVSRADDVLWEAESDRPRVGELLARGELRLREGTLRIDFFSGAAMTVRGPACVSLDGVDGVTVGQGQLAVTGHDSHFKVRTPNAVIVDVGTSFAVNVCHEGHSEVYVLEGEVAASLLGKQGTTLRERSLSEGESLSINSNAGEICELEVDEANFIEPVQPAPIPLRITDRYVAAVRASSPIGYWRFEKVERQRVANEVSDKHGAELMGALELEGDAGNRVAFFSKPSECGLFIREGFSGIYENGEYSIELWMNPANHDWSGLASLLRVGGDGDGRSRSIVGKPGSKFNPPEPRIMALECMPDRETKCWVVHEPRAIRFFHRWPTEDVKHGATHIFSRDQYFPGQWYHVVAVRESEQISLYYNGELQSRVDVSANRDEETYQLIIGRYAQKPCDRRYFSGPFSGRLDEVALYDKALSEAEVRLHYSQVER